ncbi:MAG: M23 family metallopeptidase [Elusimicrobiota bacterium]
MLSLVRSVVNKSEADRKKEQALAKAQDEHAAEYDRYSLLALKLGIKPKKQLDLDKLSTLSPEEQTSRLRQEIESLEPLVKAYSQGVRTDVIKTFNANYPGVLSKFYGVSEAEAQSPQSMSPEKIESVFSRMQEARQTETRLKAAIAAFAERLQAGKSPKAPSQDEIQSYQKEIHGLREDLGNHGIFEAVDVSPGDITMGSMETIGSSHGVLLVSNDGSISRHELSEKDRKALVKEAASSLSDDLPSAGAISSVPHELRDNGSSLRIHEGYDVSGAQAATARSPYAGQVVLASNGGDRENRILINYGDSLRDDGSLILFSLLHSGTRDKDGGNISGSGSLVLPGDHVNAHEVIALTGDTGENAVKGHLHAHGEYFVVPKDAPEREKIEQAVNTLTELAQKHHGKNPPISEDKESDYIKWINAVGDLGKRLINNRTSIGKIIDKDGKSKEVNVRLYGLYYQNYYKGIHERSKQKQQSTGGDQAE